MVIYRYRYLRLITYILISALLCWSCRALHAATGANHPPPLIKNVHFRTNDNNVFIYYNLLGKSTQKYKIQLLASINGGSSYTVNPTNITGDVGKGISPGKNKKIEWNLMEDYPNGLRGTKFQFLVKAHKEKNFTNTFVKYALIGIIAIGIGTGAVIYMSNHHYSPGLPLPPARPSH